MQRLAPVLILLLAGCSFELGPSRLVSSYGPVITFAEAGCVFEPGVGDIFYVDAEVDDPNGPLDVDYVVADIYDDAAGSFHVATIELAPTTDPYFWTAELRARTLLDCTYPGYTVDITAYDRTGYTDLVQVAPIIYAPGRLN